MFDPLPTFTGTATPVDYQVEDSLGRVYTASLTPRVTTTPPTARPATVSLLVGGTATFTVLHGNGGLVTPANGGPALDPTTACLVDPVTNLCGTTVTIAGEGTYTLDLTTGIVTYVSFGTATVGTKTPVTYRITDADGFVATQTLTPTVSTATPVNPNTNPVDPGTTPEQNSGGNDQNGSQSDSKSSAEEDPLVRTGVDVSSAILLSLFFITIGLTARRRARRFS